MTSRRKHLLVGAALLVVCGYSAATEYSAASEPSSDGSDHSVIVTGAASTDREIRAEVAKQINEQPQLRGENIDVQSFDHQVYLYGVVDTRKDAEEAEAVAVRVPGVTKVYNSLAPGGA